MFIVLCLGWFISLGGRLFQACPHSTHGITWAEPHELSVPSETFVTCPVWALWLPSGARRGCLLAMSLWNLILRYCCCSVCVPVKYLHCHWNSRALYWTSFPPLMSQIRGEQRLTCAEVGELSGHVGLLILVHLAETADRSERHRGDTTCLMYFQNYHCYITFIHTLYYIIYTLWHNNCT